MNILEIVVIIVAIALVLSGFRAGGVKKLASMLSLVLSVTLVSAILPYVTDFIRNNTPIYDYIVTQCEQVAAEQVASELLSEMGTTLTGSVSEYLTGSTASVSEYLASLTREQTKTLLEQYGYGEYASAVDSLSDEELETLKEQYLTEAAAQLLSGDGVSANFDADSGTGSSTGDSSLSSVWSSLTLDKSTQNAIIDSLPLPEVIKTMLVNNNNDDGYASLAVSNFQDYVVEYLATLILNVISFLVAVILVNIVLRLLVMVLDIIAHFPVIGFVNRLAGAGLGVLEALFALWIFFLILTVLQATEAGMALQAMVEESALLSWLYESNLFLRVMLWGASMFA
ncbi:MAG: CvpA family protein [Lachnospiraceae bacterium]|nr:CvpA family protein [Lachnospiraceae bacterium]